MLQHGILAVVGQLPLHLVKDETDAASEVGVGGQPLHNEGTEALKLGVLDYVNVPQALECPCRAVWVTRMPAPLHGLVHESCHCTAQHGDRTGLPHLTV